MTAGAKIHATKCLGLLLFIGIIWILQKTFLDEPFDYLIPSLFLLGGLWLGFFDATPLSGRWSRLAKHGFGVLLVLLSFWTARPPPPEAVLPWKPYSPEAVEQAKRLGKPVMIDFFATWCEPCLKLNQKVFGRRAVVEAAARFVALRADISDQNSPFSVTTTARYHVEVFPTVVFIGSDGKERPELRLEGLETAREFLEQMAACR